jgi:pimeloyl-ACP methyl ester carboxylesterase
LNLLPWLDEPRTPSERAALRDGWLEMARRTWGRPELRPLARRLPIADAIAARSERPALRELFLVGCGVRDGAPPLVEAALARAGDRFAFTDPAPALAGLRAPVVIAHGRDDDVVPWPEAFALARALPRGHRHRVLLTGLYGHTGASLPSPRAVATEIATMLSLAQGIVDAALERL